jgi:hypothetical protein
VRGQWVPRHFAVSIEPHKAEALLILLRGMRGDEGFPLNELEREVVDELVDMLEEDGLAVPGG